MRRTLLAAAAALALTAAPADATTDSDSTYEGGCRYSAWDDPTWLVGQPYEYTGVLRAVARLYPRSGSDRAVTATLTCRILVNGTAVVTEAFTGTTLIAGAEPIGYVAADDDNVHWCETIEFADATRGWTTCHHVYYTQLPPPEVEELLWQVVAPGGDRTACDQTSAHALPDVGRAVRTGDGGDVDVLDVHVLRCDGSR